jgi:fructose-bisphosphate aldolase class I
MNIEQSERMRNGSGFIAALDQSGGSTPKALSLYGVPASSYSSESQMFDLIWQMRARIIQNSAFNSQHILAAILFEATLERTIDGLPCAEYLWRRKGVVPFLKIDNGLLEPVNGAALMKPIPNLKSRLDKAHKYEIFGTKMRSVLALANATGVEALVSQQFEYAQVILKSDLVPIIEPEVEINSPEKSWIECLLKRTLLDYLEQLPETGSVILKLTLPDSPNYFSELINHPRVLRVVALSGGYPRAQANKFLAENEGMIASFSRALTEGLNVGQSEGEFAAILTHSIEEIFLASTQKSLT